MKRMEPCQHPGDTRTSEALSVFRDAQFVAVTPKVGPPIDVTLLRDLSKLQGISLHATGYDFIDVTELRRRGVVLSIVPDYSTTSVAEHTIGLLLTISRRIHLGNDRARALVDAATRCGGSSSGARPWASSAAGASAEPSPCSLRPSA